MTPYYEQDGITIYHGDCRDVLPLIESGAVVTDPPYGQRDLMHRTDYGQTWSKLWEVGGQQWDGETPDDVVLSLIDRELIVWGGHLFPLPPARGWLVWNKITRNWTSGECELAWTNLDQPVRAFDYARAQLASEGKTHPTQKPLPLMRWCVNFIKSDLVVDPFMGSGTTLVAAHDLGKRAIGIEIEERYCEIAVQRLAQGVLDFA